GPIGLTTKIWSAPEAGAVASVSCHAIHGPGLAGSATEPPATTGFSADSLVWMFSDGTPGPVPPLPRLCPANSHLPWLASPVLSNRLAKTLSLLKPVPVVFSYQVAHGTVRPAPAKSIAGASPSWDWSKFSEPLNVGDALERPDTVPLPLVTHT